MIIAGAVTYLIFHTVLCLAYIPSGSMIDTIPENSLVLASRVHGQKQFERGDIVIFEAKNHTTAERTDNVAYYAKRIVGLPNDTIEVIGGTTYINGEPYDEAEYLYEPVEDKDYGPYHVPEGCYFMMGDNRNHSFDSRIWDNPYVKQEEILGGVFFIFRKIL